jgi:hypothetical protein
MRRLTNCERAELLDRIAVLPRRDLGEAGRNVQTLVASAAA